MGRILFTANLRWLLSKLKDATSQLPNNVLMALQRDRIFEYIFGHRNTGAIPRDFYDNTTHKSEVNLSRNYCLYSGKSKLLKVGRFAKNLHAK